MIPNEIPLTHRLCHPTTGKVDRVRRLQNCRADWVSVPARCKRGQLSSVPGTPIGYVRLARGASFRGTSTNSRMLPLDGRDSRAIRERHNRAPIVAGRGDAAGCEGKRASAVHHVLPEGDASETRADAQDCSAGRVEPFAQRPELGLCFADAGDWFRFFACRVRGAEVSRQGLPRPDTALRPCVGRAHFRWF